MPFKSRDRKGWRGQVKWEGRTYRADFPTRKAAVEWETKKRQELQVVAQIDQTETLTDTDLVNFFNEYLEHSETRFTKRTFEDFHLHIEFRLPLLPDHTDQKRGNSGVIIEEFQFFEVQVLDCYGLPGYYDECGAIYQIAPPKVNMCLMPLQWQSYDITYRAPRINRQGKLTKPPMITVDHNGVLIHKNLELPYSLCSI